MVQKEQLDRVLSILKSCRNEMATRIVGQREMVDGLFVSLIAGGHILLEGVPGLAKTLAVKSMAEISRLDFKRIQFTPDLLPGDLTGTMIWSPGSQGSNTDSHNQTSGNFSVRRGPIFANIVLADEINRAPAKVQSALLEAMEEKQVTIGDSTYPLPNPFFVLATENPIEHEGTYSLPEAELDRFLMKLLVVYPQPIEELDIVKKNASRTSIIETPLNAVLNTDMLNDLRNTVDRVHIDEGITKYIISIVAATRPVYSKTDSTGLRVSSNFGSSDGVYRYVTFGASPRASIALYKCAKILSLFQGRDYVTPEDVKTAALPVLRHRIVLSYEAEAEGMDADAVISRILSHVPLP